jgi:hypothetical protein
MALRETQVMALGISDSFLFGEAVTSLSVGIVRGTRERPRRRGSQGFRRFRLTRLRRITKLVYDAGIRGTARLKVRFSISDMLVLGVATAVSAEEPRDLKVRLTHFLLLNL